MTFITVSAVFVFALLLLPYVRQIHVGCGAILCRKNDGTIWVAAVLPHSPAAQAGILYKTRLHSIDNVFMYFSDTDVFQKWMKDNPPKLGLRKRYQLIDGRVVTIKPTVLFDKPSMRWHPDNNEVPTSDFGGLTA